MKTTIALAALVPLTLLLLVPLANAQVAPGDQTQTQQQPQQQSTRNDMWHMWVFIYNMPVDAHNITVSMMDDSNQHNQIANATIDANLNATGDPKAPSATWQSFDIPNSVIGSGTGYYVCLTGEDIKNQCSQLYTHNGNNTDTSTAFDWALLEKRTNETTHYPGSQYHGTMA